MLGFLGSWRLSRAVGVCICVVFFASSTFGDEPGTDDESAVRYRVEEIVDAIHAGQVSDGEKAARELLAEAEEEYGPDSVEVADVLGALVESLWRGGKATDPETLKFAERAIEINKERRGLNSPALADSYVELALVYHRMKNYSDAIVSYERALPIYERATGPESYEVAVVLNSLGNTYRSVGNYDDAESSYLRAMEIGEMARGPDDELVNMALGNLGYVEHLIPMLS